MIGCLDGDNDGKYVGSIKGCVILFKGEIDGWTFG
jgi:hypothetical protein